MSSLVNGLCGILAILYGEGDFVKTVGIAVSAGSGSVGDAACDVVSVSLGGTESRLCIDSSGQVLKQSYQGKHPLQGSPGLIEVLFSNYAELGGAYFPTTHSMLFEGEEVLTITVNSLEVNPDLDPAMFAVN